jgi:hypothetical protein
MKVIVLEKIWHNNQNNIALRFDFDKETSETLKEILKAKWSKTNKCWLVPYSKLVFDTLTVHFGERLKFTHKNTEPLKPIINIQENELSLKVHDNQAVISYLPKNDNCHLLHYGTRLLIFIKPNPSYILHLQTIKGIFFDKTRKCWNLPNQDAIIDNLSLFFGEKLIKLNSNLPKSKSSKIILDKNIIKIWQPSIGNILIELAYNKQNTSFLKTLDGAIWNIKNYHWEIYNTKINIEKLNEYFDPKQYIIEYPTQKKIVKKNKSSPKHKFKNNSACLP